MTIAPTCPNFAQRGTASADFSGLGHQPTPEVSKALHGAEIGYEPFAWAADIPTVLRQAANRVGALSAEAATMACDLDAQAKDLTGADEAICNFAEQRNEAMREVDRLLVENARLRADVERASGWADDHAKRASSLATSLEITRASRDEACGLLREARSRIVDLERDVEFLHNDWMAIVAERDEAQARTYTDKQRVQAARACEGQWRAFQDGRTMQLTYTDVVDAVANALGMSRAEA